jgi:hypothetical protein
MECIHKLRAKSISDMNGIVAEVHFSRSRKLIYVGMRDPVAYLHGLTLSNFCELGGVYPTRERVIQLLREMPLPSPPQRRHGDIQPWNIRFDGEKMTLIDPAGDDWGCEDAEGLSRTIECVDAEMRKWQ